MANLVCYIAGHVWLYCGRGLTYAPHIYECDRCKKKDYRFFDPWGDK